MFFAYYCLIGVAIHLLVVFLLWRLIVRCEREEEFNEWFNETIQSNTDLNPQTELRLLRTLFLTNLTSIIMMTILWPAAVMYAAALMLILKMKVSSEN